MVGHVTITSWGGLGACSPRNFSILYLTRAILRAFLTVKQFHQFTEFQQDFNSCDISKAAVTVYGTLF